MAKITDYEGKFPKRIGDYVLYKLGDVVIMRNKSGFTSKKLKTSPKYDLCRKNASEFGSVSSLCKIIRVALKPFLPKKNNLEVVNSFTKKMRSVLVFDSKLGKGNRLLHNALSTNEGCEAMLNYCFNPLSNLQIAAIISNSTIQFNTATVVFPSLSNFIGFRIINLHINLLTMENRVEVEDWHFFAKKNLNKKLIIPIIQKEEPRATTFTLIEIEFFKSTSDSFIPFEDDSSKQLQILNCFSRVE